MAEQNNRNNNDNYQSFNNPQETQYSYLFVSEQHTLNPFNIENNIPFSNEELNEQFLSSKRKIFQIIFSIILYILGLSLLLFIINIKIKKYYIYGIIIASVLFIVSILDIILASIIVYYTKKNQNSRNKGVSIFSGIISLIIDFFFLLISPILISEDKIDFFDFYFDFENDDKIFAFIIFLNFIFSIILVFFISKSKCCKCFD